MTSAGAPRSERSFGILLLWLMLVTTAIVLVRYMDLVVHDRARLFDDFIFFANAAKKLGEGRIADIYSAAGMQHYLSLVRLSMVNSLNPESLRLVDYPFVYPPPMLLLLWPLGHASYTQALMWWFGCGTFLYVAAFMSLPYRRLFPHLEPRLYKVIAPVLAVPTILVVILCGQTGLVTGALFIAGLGWLFTRPVLAGLCFGALVIKPHLALLVPLALIAGGHWRALGTMAATAVAIIAASFLLGGLTLWQGFFANLLPQTQLIALGHPRILQMMVSVYGSVRLFGLSHGDALMLQCPVFILACVIVWRAFRCCRDEGLLVALLSVCTCMASPYVFVYDMSILLLPMLYMTDKAMQGTMTGLERKLFILGCFLMLLSFKLNELHLPASVLFNAGVSFALVRRVLPEKKAA